MPRDPGSLWCPLPEAGAPDGYIKRKFIVHSTGDNASAAAIRRYFLREDVVVESTFIIGWGPEDPTLQIMDSSDRADANVAANDDGISVEVVGDGRTGYNDWQRAELLRLGLWARGAHPEIRAQVIPDASPSAAGFGWHVMFGAPGPWTTVAKVCPGALRIRELEEHILPAIFTGGRAAPRVAPGPPPPPKLPAWRLPRGHYYGHVNGPARSHGGYYPAERPVVRAIQQWLIWRGCVPGVEPADWRTSRWADGIWEDATSDAVRRWFQKYRPGQPFVTRIYSDDYARLDG